MTVRLEIGVVFTSQASKVVVVVFIVRIAESIVRREPVPVPVPVHVKEMIVRTPASASASGPPTSCATTNRHPIRRRIRQDVPQPSPRRPSLDELFVILEPGMVRDRIGSESVRRIVRLDRFRHRVELVVRDEARRS